MIETVFLRAHEQLTMALVGYIATEGDPETQRAGSVLVSIYVSRLGSSVRHLIRGLVVLRAEEGAQHSIRLHAAPRYAPAHETAAAWTIAREMFEELTQARRATKGVRL
jgi:hypothetical protein